MLGTVEQPKFKVAGFHISARPLTFLIVGAMRILYLTLRVRLVDEGDFLTRSDKNGYIFAMWHNRLFMMPVFFSLCLKKRKGVLAITSASREGTLLTRIFQKFGISTVRGSTSRGGHIATLGLIKALKEGFDAGITPDGPRGPRYRMSPGVVYLAWKSGRPIIPVQVEIKPCIRLRSWDRFLLPLPFSRVEIRMMPAFQVDPTLDSADLKPQLALLEELMQPVTL